ncbi:MAG: hypothetical protein O6951_08995 [Actinobacteria bacterium]|nr:hypothetical protein [Actinomycetota bacterium]
MVQGEQIRIRGEGYAPNGIVTVTVHEQDAVTHQLGTVTADANGDINAVVTLPLDVAETLVLFQALGPDSDGGDRALTRLADAAAGLVVCEAPAAPSVVVTSPADGRVYDFAEELVADYSCEFGGEPVTCLASVAVGDPISTTTPGTYQFSVVGVAPDGITTTAVTHTYQVLDPVVLDDPLAGYAVFGTRRVELGRDASVISGNVGVNEAATSGAANLVVSRGAMVGEATTTEADWIRVEKDAVVHDVAYNTLTNLGTILGAQSTPLIVPLVSLAPVPEVMAGTSDVEIRAGEVAVLHPGAYRNVVVHQGAVVTFTGGKYQLASLSIDRDASIEFAADTVLEIAGALDVDMDVTVGPQVGSEAQVRIVVVGFDSVDEMGVLIPVAQFNSGIQITAIVEAFNGTLRVDDGGKVVGSLRAALIVIGKDVEITLPG